jgi:hypothetical protein
VRPRGSGDLDTLVADLYLDTQSTTDCFDVLAQRVDLGAPDVAVLDPRDAVLADLQPGCKLDRRQLGRLKELTQPGGTDFVEHALRGRIHLGAIDRTIAHQVVKTLRH